MRAQGFDQGFRLRFWCLLPKVHIGCGGEGGVERIFGARKYKMVLQLFNLLILADQGLI